MKNRKEIASRMRQRITFQSESGASDEVGGSDVSWTSFTTVWAEVKPVSGRSSSSERTVAGKVEGRSVMRITTRYISGITADMRIIYGSRAFNIRSVVNIEERGEILEIVAEEGVAD